jgi:hypothetical protein
MARKSSPKSAAFLSVSKTYASLTEEERKNFFVGKSDTPGIFNFCVFPSPVTLPPESKHLIDVLNAVAEIVNDSNGQLFTNKKA